MRTTAFAAAALLLVAPAALAAAPAVGDSAPPISVKDIKGRAVTVPLPGTVSIVSFASKATGEKGGDLTRAVRLDHPDLNFVSIVDVSGYPGILHGIVKSKLSSRHDDGVKEDAAAFTKAGKPVPAKLDEQLHLVPDWDAKACKAYGATDTGKQAAIAVIGADGKIAALFLQTPKVDDVKAAVEKALAAAPAPAPAPTAK